MGLKQSLISYLLRYSDFSNDITLVYRPTLKDHWGDRAKFLGEKYNHHKPYNHRSILPQEIVIEYDTDDMSVNMKCVDKVRELLKKDGIKYAKWTSGNKSSHLHFMLDFDVTAVNYRFLLKRVIMRYYGTFYVKDGVVYTQYINNSKKIEPDIRLAEDKHLVRAEFGVHEKTGKHKTLYMKDKDYPCLSRMPGIMWILYQDEVRKHLARKAQYHSTDIKGSKYIKYLLSTDFRDAEDGRERALFILIQALKGEYESKEDFVKLMQDWYKYAGGTKMSSWQIACKVNYHWEKSYIITEAFIKEFIDELGVDI